MTKNWKKPATDVHPHRASALATAKARSSAYFSQRQILGRPLQVGGALVEGADRFLLVARERENSRRQQQEGGKDLHARRRAHGRAVPAAAVCRRER